MSVSLVRIKPGLQANLLITNGEFALGLLVLLGESLELLDRLSLRNSNTELDIGFGVFVSRLEKVGVSK